MGKKAARDENERGKSGGNKQESKDSRRNWMHVIGPWQYDLMLKDKPKRRMREGHDNTGQGR